LAAWLRAFRLTVRRVAPARARAAERRHYGNDETHNEQRERTAVAAARGVQLVHSRLSFPFYNRINVSHRRTV